MAPKIERTTPEAVQNDYVITYSTGSKKWTNDRPGDGVGDLEGMLDDIAVQRGLDAIANSIKNDGKDLKSAVDAMVRDTGTDKGQAVLNAVYKGMKESNAPEKQVHGWGQARGMVAGVKDVVEKIFDTFPVNKATEIAERLVQYYKTKDSKYDLTPREQGQIYNRVDYGDTLPLTKKRKLDVEWTNHGEYRSDLRDIDPDDVNHAVQKRLKDKLNPPQRKTQKFKEPGVGHMVVDFNTQKKPADAKVLTVYGSSQFFDKGDIGMDTTDLEIRVAQRFANNDNMLVTPRQMQPYCEDCASKIASGEMEMTWGELRELLADNKRVAAKGIFDAMTDRQIKKFIEGYAEMAPEDFWMDGEFDGTYDERVKDLMRWWRSMNPKFQRQIYDDYSRYINQRYLPF